jgi:arylsulfatase A-like enzyme
MIRMSRGLALLALAALAAGCAAQGPAGARAGGARTPVVLVTIDTLRADRLPAYGYAGVETPAVDALRRDAVLFENAYTHCPLTLPAHASLLTGLLPPEHGVRNNVGYRLDPRRDATLAALLKARGYATGAAVSAYVLRRGTGLEDGFDFYSEVASAAGASAAGELQRPGTETVQAALDWLSGVQGRPFFLFVHLYEPHAPYEPPEPLRARHGATYDGEVAAADAALGQLIEGLRAAARYDEALVILASDHGEGLGEHGEQEHGILLYRETLRVPLIVKLPHARRAGATASGAVGLRDVLPSVAALLGFAPPERARGVDLLASGSGAGQYGETYYPRIHLGWSELRSWVDGRFHYIAAPRPELYELPRDPAERNDLAGASTDTVRDMRTALERTEARFAPPEAATSEERERLASLGYLAGGAAVQAGPLPNPRDEIAGYAKIRAAFQLSAAGEHARALAAFDALLAANPRLFDVAVERGALLARLGRHADAERAYLDALALAPRLAGSVALSLGRLRLEMGKLDQAASDARAALAAEPDAAHELLAAVALARGDLEEAEREARLVTGDAGARARSAVILAEAEARRGRLDAALAALSEAASRAAGLGLGPVPGSEFVRGDVLARLGRHAEAERALRAEIAAFPRNARAYASLAIVVALRGGSREECREILETMARARPGADTARLAAKTLDFVGDAEGARAWRRRAGEGSPG